MTGSRAVIVLLAAMVLALSLGQRLWKKPGKVIHNDVISYYQYLPAVFIFNDISLKDFVGAKDESRIWVHDAGKGRGIGKMTMGMAVLYLPFFLTAHWLAVPLGYEASGFSPPYALALVLSAVFYLYLGLYFLRKVLLRYFADRIVSLVLVVLTVGTNMLFYSVFEPAMSHVFSFSLFALFLYLLIGWLEKPGRAGAMFLGLVTGLIILVRPVNGILLLLVPLWGVATFGDLRERVQRLPARWPELVIMLVAAFLVVLPQMLYWKYITGHFLFFGYGGERFFWGNPQFYRGLISYKKGWLVYTPVMWLAITGLVILWRRYRGIFMPVMVFTLLNMYVVFSWWCWYAGGSFGMRFLIESYVLLAFPLAAFLEWTAQQGWHLRLPITVILLFLLFLNVFQSFQYRYGAIHYAGMTREAYWHNFLKMKPAKGFLYTVREYDLEKARLGIYVEKPSARESFEAYFQVSRQAILSSKEWLDHIEEKAALKGIPVDSIIYLDIRWMWGQKQAAKEN